MQVYFFSIFKYGHEAVLFFFVLSGFVIHLKQAKEIERGRAVLLKGYFIRRAKRIFPPFLFALLLTFFCDKVVEFIDASIFHNATPDEGLNTNISFDHSLKTLAGNILFLQNTYVPIFGSDAPLWSLKYEWWFYMFYPLLLLVNKKTALGSFLIVALLSVLSILGWSWGIKLVDEVFAYFFCWWLGCLSADMYANRIKVPVWLIILAGLLLLYIPLSVKYDSGNAIVKDTIIAVGFWGLLNSLFLLQKRQVSFRLLEKLKPLGDCSYSIYVIHMPILVLANGIILNYSHNVMPKSMTYVWLSILIIPVLGYLIHLLVERPFVRKATPKLPEQLVRV
jgi:peptidoglycan/LPS O-acetylase OafA/YrhL